MGGIGIRANNSVKPEPVRTESRTVFGRGQPGLVQALEEIAQALPFRQLGIDTGSGSEFHRFSQLAGGPLVRPAAQMSPEPRPLS